MLMCICSVIDQKRSQRTLKCGESSAIASCATVSTKEAHGDKESMTVLNWHHHFFCTSRYHAVFANSKFTISLRLSEINEESRSLSMLLNFLIVIVVRSELLLKSQLTDTRHLRS